MEISSTAKQIVKAIGARELTFSQLQRVFGEEKPIGADLQLLEQMGIVESLEGYITVTDVGLKIVNLEGNEISEELTLELGEANRKRSEIKINKPGEALRKYKSSMGESGKKDTTAMEKYKAGIARNKAARESPKAKQPEGDFRDEDEPALEGAGEGIESENVTTLTSKTIVNCPIFSKASASFCNTMCAGFDNGCSVTEKMAERLRV